MDVSLPAAAGDRKPVVIRCQVRVMRTDTPGLGTAFGIGCKIENYTFIPAEPPAG